MKDVIKEQWPFILILLCLSSYTLTADDPISSGIAAAAWGMLIGFHAGGAYTYLKIMLKPEDK